jgi:hypothetical protein
MPPREIEGRVGFHELPFPSVSLSRRELSTYLIFYRDNISDGMMTRETDILSDCVMNALWLPERYAPTQAPCKEQPQEELNPGKLARELVLIFHSRRRRADRRIYRYSFWSRCIPDCGPGPQARFKETLALFFEAVNIQARARDDGVIPDLESYIDVRRDTSGRFI